MRPKARPVILKLTRPPHPNLAALADPDLLAAHARAAGAIARLDQALEGHPLLPAFLHRARLDAVRRQAAVDGQRIDPWHLAAVLEGLRLRMDHELRIIDRGQVFEAARAALALHQWLKEPDFDQEGEIKAAEQHLTALLPGGLSAAAQGIWTWLNGGGARPPLRAALIRYWQRVGLLRVPVPLTGAFALRADAPEDQAEWVVAFFEAVAEEAADYSEMLRDLERGWLEARDKIRWRRSNSRAARAVDLLAAAPLLSATTLAGAIGMSIKCAGEMLEQFATSGVVVEVTHRSARRLFGLGTLAPMRDVVQLPYRPSVSRRRGRPSREVVPEVMEEKRVLSPLERKVFDYGDLEAAIAQLDVTISDARRRLNTLHTAQ